MPAHCEDRGGGSSGGDEDSEDDPGSDKIFMMADLPDGTMQANPIAAR
jgi:hypothetical protein